MSYTLYMSAYMIRRRQERERDVCSGCKFPVSTACKFQWQVQTRKSAQVLASCVGDKRLQTRRLCITAYTLTHRIEESVRTCYM